MQLRRIWRAKQNEKEYIIRRMEQRIQSKKATLVLSES